jgi:hypothetical protein
MNGVRSLLHIGVRFASYMLQKGTLWCSVEYGPYFSILLLRYIALVFMYNADNNVDNDTCKCGKYCYCDREHTRCLVVDVAILCLRNGWSHNCLT